MIFIRKRSWEMKYKSVKVTLENTPLFKMQCLFSCKIFPSISCKMLTTTKCNFLFQQKITAIAMVLVILRNLKSIRFSRHKISYINDVFMKCFDTVLNRTTICSTICILCRISRNMPPQYAHNRNRGLLTHS